MDSSENRTDCTPDAPIAKKQRRYTGPPKGSNEAKERMATGCVPLNGPKMG